MRMLISPQTPTHINQSEMNESESSVLGCWNTPETPPGEEEEGERQRHKSERE